MRTKKPKSASLSVRVTDSVRDKFHVKALPFGLPSDVLRELIDAFIDDRITVKPRNRKEFFHVS